MSDDLTGKAIEQRHKDLGLTQENVAFLAGVSVTTVRNLIHGRVSPAGSRSWPAIERALGWAPGSIEHINPGPHGYPPPAELLPFDALKPLLTAIVRSASATVRARYNEFALILEADHEGHSFDGKHVEAFAAAHLWEAVRAHLTSAEAEPLVEELRAWGVRGAAATDARLPDASAEQGATGRPMGIALLPLFLAELLENGMVRDWNSRRTPDGTMQVVTMAVTNGTAEPSARDRKYWVDFMNQLTAQRELEHPPPEE